MDGLFSKSWFKIGILIVLLAVIASFGYKLWANADKGSESMVKADQRQPAPSFELESSEGKMVKFSDFDDKVKLVYFFFSNCPDVCPMSTQKLTQVQELLINEKLFGNKVHMLSISFDPERDSPERLKQFSQSYGVKPEGWTFLRGQDEESIKELALKYGIGVLKDPKGNFMHTNIVLMVDKKGMIRAYYDIMDETLKPETIVKDLKKVAKE